MDWTPLTDFLRLRTQELIGTELNQIRFTDIGMTYWLSIVVALVAVVTLVRLWLIAPRHRRSIPVT